MILIAGAGIGGLTLGCALRRIGRPFRIIERASIEDAVVFADALAKEDSIPAALARYQARRVRRVL